ncbi:hypothetical protein F7725_023626, partial [Dissostichus mawsoni]
MVAVFGFSSAFANSYVWVDTDHRSFIGVIGSLSWCLGNMLLAAFAYLVNDWRNLTMTATAPLGLAILTWWWIPESARWLLAHGKVEKAKFYIDKCAKFNKRGDLSSKINLEVSLSLMSLSLSLYGIASTYYGISLNISGLGLNIYLTHFIYAAIEVPAKLMVYCCLNIVGRRKAKRPGLLQRHESSGGLSAPLILMLEDVWTPLPQIIICSVASVSGL